MDFPQTTADWLGTYTRFACPYLSPSWSVAEMSEEDWALYRYIRDLTPEWGTPLSRQAYKALTGGGRGRHAKRPSYKLYRKLLGTEHAAKRPHAPSVAAESVNGSS